MAKKTPAPPALRDDVSDQALSVSPDELQVKNDGLLFTTFMKGLAGFFATATALEQTATTKLARARALVAPTNSDEDVTIQEFVKGVNRDDTDIDNHWTICGVLYRLHRKTTEGRDRGKDMNKLSRQIATKLHNDYVDAERRRAAEKQEADRRARELEARQQQERDAAEMDRKALEAEAHSETLSEREALFVSHVFIGAFQGDIVKAAQNAGYKDPAAQAKRLMDTGKIQRAIQAKRDGQRLREQAEATRRAPVDVRTEEVKPDIKKAPGTHDRTTWGAELLDPDRFATEMIASLRDELAYIPHSTAVDLLKVAMRSQEVKTFLNEQGKSLHEKIDLWPGVRHTKKTGIV